MVPSEQKWTHTCVAGRAQSSQGWIVQYHGVLSVVQYRAQGDEFRSCGNTIWVIQDDTLRNWNQSRFWWLASLFQGKINWCDRWEECDDHVFSSLFERHLWLNWIDVSFSHVRKQHIYTPVINLYHHNSLRHQMLNHIIYYSFQISLAHWLTFALTTSPDNPTTTKEMRRWHTLFSGGCCDFCRQCWLTWFKWEFHPTLTLIYINVGKTIINHPQFHHK